MESDNKYMVTEFMKNGSLMDTLRAKRDVLKPLDLVHMYYKFIFIIIIIIILYYYSYYSDYFDLLIIIYYPSY